MALTTHLDAELSAVSEAAAQTLQSLPALELMASADLDRGLTLAESRHIPAEQLDALYASAWALCEDGQFDKALPVVLLLASHAAPDARHLFLAATCFQRTHKPAQAAQMYVQCLLMDAQHYAAMFRLGECLQAMGDNEKAMGLFDAVIGITPSDTQYDSLRHMAQQRNQGLRDAGW